MINNSLDATFVSESPDKPWRLQARVSWILMSVVGVIAILPFFGFAVWLIAGPMMLTSFIMIVMVFSKGGVRHGLALLACQLVVMPVVIIFGPVVSSLLGLTGAAGAVAATAATVDAVSSQSLPEDDRSSSDIMPLSAPAMADMLPVSMPMQLPAELVQLKDIIQTHQPLLFSLKKAGTAKETTNGYMVSDERADLAARKAVQQENVWREQVFKQIAALTNQPPEAVAAEFARLAAGVSP
jgi:uncharacterized protein YdbL (DUF1318 family)